MEQIYVPSLNKYSINCCIDQLLKTTDDVVLNFSNTSVVRSFEMLIFLINVLQLKKNRLIQIDDHDLHERGASYAKNMKLFDAIKDPSSIIGFPRENFSYITRVDYNFLYNFSDVYDWHKGLECYSEKLANILIEKDSINNNLKDLLHYCIREIIRNTLEHNERYQQRTSNSNDLCSVYIAAQKHSWDGVTELAFADNGVGIKKTLLDSGHIIQNDLDALNLALQPGISSLSYINNDEWDNSGFGLFMTSGIMKQIGSFTLYSMEGGIEVDRLGVHTINNAYIPGTAIKLEVNHNALSLLKESSNEIIKNLTTKGESMARNNNRAIKTASKKSKTIY